MKPDDGMLSLPPASRSSASGIVDPGREADQSGVRSVVIRQVPAVARAAAILRLLSRDQGPLGVHAIARSLSLVPSTCLHILRALVAEELVSFDPATKRYMLSSGIVALARGMLRRDPFNNLVQPVLDRLSSRHGVTAIGIEVASLEHMVVVAISRPGQAFGLQVDVGSRYPALVSASGRCIAAFGGFEWKEIEKRFQAIRWDNPPTLAQWLCDIEETRSAGFAVDEGRYMAGVTVITAPVAPGTRMSYGLVVLGVSEQLHRIGHMTLGEQLVLEAASLSRRLEIA